MIPSLNFLAPNDQREIRRARIFLLIHESILLIFIIVTIGSGLLFGAGVILENKFQEMTLGPKTASAKIAVLNKDIKLINQKLTQLNHAAVQTYAWSPLLAELISQTPTGIAWMHATFQVNGTFTLQGRARAREDLLTFRDHLAASARFENVNLPLQYLTETADIQFAIELQPRRNQLDSPL